MEYKSNNNVVYTCKYHVVWCPKYRRKVLIGTISERLKELIHQKCFEIKVDIIELEIMPNHVHLLIEVDPQFGINRAVRSIKGFTSHTLRKEFKELTTRLPTLWTDGAAIRKEFYGKSKSEAETKRDEYLEGLKNGLTFDYDKLKL